MLTTLSAIAELSPWITQQLGGSVAQSGSHDASRVRWGWRHVDGGGVLVGQWDWPRQSSVDSRGSEDLPGGLAGTAEFVGVFDGNVDGFEVAVGNPAEWGT